MSKNINRPIIAFMSDLGIKNVEIIGCPSLLRHNNPYLQVRPKPWSEMKRVAFNLRREVSPHYANDVARYLDVQKRMMRELHRQFDLTVTVMTTTEVSYEDAIRWITINPARALGIDDVTGSLEPGKNADVVVWSGDPFEVTTVVEHVFIRGRQMPVDTRQRELFLRYRTVDGAVPPAYRRPVQKSYHSPFGRYTPRSRCGPAHR